MISPAGHMQIRIDRKGSGLFGAPRGWRLHQGIDLEMQPGAQVISPEDGKLIRVMLPYGKDSPFRGLIIKSRKLIHKLMYTDIASAELIGTRVTEGQVVGILQDIRERYGREIKPHLHWEICIDPEYLITELMEVRKDG